MKQTNPDMPVGQQSPIRPDSAVQQASPLLKLSCSRILACWSAGWPWNFFFPFFFLVLTVLPLWGSAQTCTAMERAGIMPETL